MVFYVIYAILLAIFTLMLSVKKEHEEWLRNKCKKNKIKLCIIFIISFIYSLIFGVIYAYKVKIDSNILKSLFDLTILYLIVSVIFIIFFIIKKLEKWLKSKSKCLSDYVNKSEYLSDYTKGFALSILSFIISVFLSYLVFIFSSKNSQFFLALIFIIYCFFNTLPFNFYLSKYFYYENLTNYYFFSTAILFMAIILASIYVISSRPSVPFKMLKIGGSIPINLLVSQKYFNELINHGDSNTAKNILKWYKFKLLLKTPDSYYIKYKKITNFLIIPVKYVYAKSYNNIKTNKNSNKFYNHNKNLIYLDLLLGLNKCISYIVDNKQYCGRYEYGYFIK